MLLRVNDEAVLGRPHRDVVKMFEQVAPGQTAALQLLRGYPLPADAEDETQQNNIPKVVFSKNFKFLIYSLKPLLPTPKIQTTIVQCQTSPNLPFQHIHLPRLEQYRSRTSRSIYTIIIIIILE